MFQNEVGAMAVTAGAILLGIVAICLRQQKADNLEESALAKKMVEFAKKVEVARRSPVPRWAKGVRPSDQCIAIHREENPNDKSVHQLYLAKMVEGRKSCPEWPVPAQFLSEKVEAFGVLCFWANWPGIDISGGVVLFLHGGAMVTGNVDLDFCAHLSRATGKAVLTVDYRMAPEHPLPAATEDVVSVYRWLLEEKHVPAGKIALYGRSAGATLVVLALQDMLNQELPLPACGIPVSVWIPHFTQHLLWQVVVGNTDAHGQSTGKSNDVHDAKFNALSGKFQGMPPLYVMVGELENVDRDLNASIRLAQVAGEAGVHVKLDVVSNMQHCPDDGLGFVPEALQAVTRAATFLDSAMMKRS